MSRELTVELNGAPDSVVSAFQRHAEPKRGLTVEFNAGVPRSVVAAFQRQAALERNTPPPAVAPRTESRPREARPSRRRTSRTRSPGRPSSSDDEELNRLRANAREAGMVTVGELVQELFVELARFAA